MKLALLVIGLAAVLIVAALSPAQSPQSGAAGGQAVVYLGERGPLLLRFHIHVDGKPLETAWDDCLVRLFKHFDANDNGILDKNEADKVLPAPMLFAGGFFAVGTLQAPPGADRGGKVTPQELAEFYRYSGGAPFQLDVRAGRGDGQGIMMLGLGGVEPPSSERLTAALMALLDTNRDGKLSRQELAKAAAVLMKLDADEDEVLTPAELLPAVDNPLLHLGLGGLGGQAGAAPSASPFVLVPPGRPSAVLARRLLAHYRPKNAGAGKQTLARKDLGLDQATFERLDRNRDGVLDEQELARFAERARDVEFTVRFGGKAEGIELHGTQLAGLVRKYAVGPLVLEAGAARLALRCDGLPPADKAEALLRNTYRAQFEAADTNGDGHVDAEEARKSGFLNATFKVIQRDRDGKLSEMGLHAFVDVLQRLRAVATRSCVSLQIADVGRGLFDLLDANRDGRLSVRELRDAVELIERFDRNGDGLLDLSELPRNYQLMLRPGGAGGQAPSEFVVLFDAGPPPRPTSATGAGPKWFRKMDGNRDGDVSRREFLGTAEEFRLLDTDGDGLIGVDEAEAADLRYRKR